MKQLSTTTETITVRKKTILAMLIVSSGLCLGSLPLAARDPPAASTTGTESYPPTFPTLDYNGCLHGRIEFAPTRVLSWGVL